MEMGACCWSFGIALTGIHWHTERVCQVPTTRFDGGPKKEMGTDFFEFLTFPYKTSHATLILGGWGGALYRYIMHRRV